MDTETTAARVYSIPERNYAAFEQRFNRLQRRAVKLASGTISVTRVGTEDWRAYQKFHAEAGWQTEFVRPGVAPRPGWTPAGFSRLHILVTIAGDAPRLNGWSFAGSIEIVTDEDGKVLGNLLRSIPGREMPVEFRAAMPWCHHCGVNRHWKSTFVVVHDDGTAKQVGRRRLADFTGHNSPEAVAAMAELLQDFANLADCSEDEDWGCGGSGKRYYDSEMLLQKVSAIIRRDGWKPKSCEEAATVNTLNTWMFSDSPSVLRKIEEAYPVEDAEKAMDWMCGLGDGERTLSEYENNLSLLARARRVEARSFGFIASGIAAYMRHIDRELVLQLERKASQYLGKVGERTEMTLTMVTFFSINTSYGTMHIIKFKTDEGSIVIWKTSTDPGLSPGDRVRVKATVSSHAEYRGTKQTEVKRMTIVDKERGKA